MKTISVNGFTINMCYSKNEDYYDFIVKKDGEHIEDFHSRSDAYQFAKTHKTAQFLTDKN